MEYHQGIDMPVYMYTYTLRTYYGMIHIELSTVLEPYRYLPIFRFWSMEIQREIVMLVFGAIIICNAE